MLMREAVTVRGGAGNVLFGERPADYTGISAEIVKGEQGFSLRSFDGSGAIPATADILCCAGKCLWDQGVRECPVTLRDRGEEEEHLILCSTCGEDVTAVTAGVGKADFLPKNIPLRFEKPLINDPVTLPDSRPFRLTALRFQVPYAVIFVDTAGDCLIFDRGREISAMSLFPQGAEVLFVYARGEKELHIRTRHRDGGTDLRGNDICAALAAAVAAGRCLPDTAVKVPLPKGDARAVCTKDWDLFLTMPILS